MDHAVCSYTIRCHNPDAGRGKDDAYHYLNKVGNYDLYELIAAFIDGKREYFKLDSTKQTYKFDSVRVDRNSRIISGWMQYGHYGMKSDIINIMSNLTEFNKTPQNADIANYFFMFWVPVGRDGVAIFHTIRSDGVKSIFQSEFQQYLKRYIDRCIQMNSLSYDKTLQEWANAEMKEISVLRLKEPGDIADIPLKLGNVHASFVITPQKNKSLGFFRNYLSSSGDEARLVEELDELGGAVKVVLELNGKKRTFRIGRSSKAAISEIVLPDTVEMNGGVPEFSSISAWVSTILAEYQSLLYPSKD